MRSTELERASEISERTKQLAGTARITKVQPVSRSLVQSSPQKSSSSERIAFALSTSESPKPAMNATAKALDRLVQCAAAPDTGHLRVYHAKDLQVDLEHDSQAA